MAAFTSTSKARCLLGFAALFALALALAAPSAQAQTDGAPRDRTTRPEEDDFRENPFTQYGEYNEDADEAEDIRFFQYGRFFGISLGAGYMGVTGNRGALWQGGFPAMDVRIHAWFDMNFAIQMGFLSAPYDFVDSDGEPVTVTHTRYGIDLKYYFDTKNLAAPITFANPYLLIGGGSYTKSESRASTGNDKDSKFAFNVGGGFEFVLKPRKTFFVLEGKMHFPRYKDNNSADFQATRGIDDLNGYFYTMTASVLFTW